MNRPVRSTSTMSSAMLSLPMAMVQPWRFEVGDARAEAAPRGDGGIEGHGDARLAQKLLFAGLHAAAMGADQPVVQEAQVRQVFRGQPVAVRLDGRDLAPDLVEMDGGPGVEPLLQGAQIAQQLGRAHVGRPGRGGDAQAAVRLAVPFAERVLDDPEMALAQRAVEPVGRRIADRGAGRCRRHARPAGSACRSRPAPRHSRRRRWNPRAPGSCRCASPPARPVAPSRGARRGSCRAAGSATARRRRAACAAARDPRTRRAPGSW